MANKLIIITLIFSIMACSAPKGLPSVEDVPTYPFGSYIEVILKSRKLLIGELISCEDNKVYVLSKFNNQCVYVAENDIRSFKIKPVDPENYSWSIPVLSLLSISHGFFLLFTLPINLTSTIMLTSKGYYQYEYTNRDLDYGRLKMYSRFPDGIPKNIKVEDIKSGLY